jgi:hypothetical protein
VEKWPTVRYRHAAIEFLVKEETPAAEIHHRFERVYGDVCMGASSLRQWVKHFKEQSTDITDQPVALFLERPLLNTTKKGLMHFSETIDV